ncbi:NAD(P)H-quinone oxidoreductase [Paludifilum halophilum]|uniref:NADPH:quinone oxidoreductase n=1 Tax=Paludifilum halophilum TaxID=1642702 RepID=A0A235B6Y3_9BACL|nr:NAD(P)H-quinone oxidoreductase [Paludifilum halophilum]OYD07365.1 NADPH:quinone oxidoreductase [Paludifilum halophilum]
MKAVLMDQQGGADQLRLGEAPAPKLTDDELLIRVKATALNRADIAQREGKYPPPPGASPLLGLEMAGVVEEVGANCSGWSKGDPVFGLLPGGGYAEYAVIPGDMAMPIPEGLSFEEAAAIAEVFLTAYQTLFWLGSLEKDQRVLIHAGASGVGTAAIQLAKWAGARVFVTAGSEKKLDVCRKLGADHGINYKEEAFDTEVKKATEGEGVDLILDFIGASYWEKNMASLGLDGTLVLISTLSGTRLDHFNLAPFLAKRIQVIGTTLRSRSLSYKIRLSQDFSRNALPLFEDGRLKPVVDRVFPMEEVQEAHRYMEANKNIGKIILRITP